jgi:hypothetical protein
MVATGLPKKNGINQTQLLHTHRKGLEAEFTCNTLSATSQKFCEDCQTSHRESSGSMADRVAMN